MKKGDYFYIQVNNLPEYKNIKVIKLTYNDESQYILPEWNKLGCYFEYNQYITWFKIEFFDCMSTNYKDNIYDENIILEKGSDKVKYSIFSVK